MLGQGFRRGGSVLFNAGKGALSRRVMNQHRRALAMSTCLAHNVSLANTAPNTIGSALPKITSLDTPSLGLGQELLTESATLTELMSLIEQMGLSHLFVSDAFYATIVSLLPLSPLSVLENTTVGRASGNINGKGISLRPTPTDYSGGMTQIGGT